MPREIRDGVQNFATFRENDLFYIDKTDFLRQWWLGAPDSSEVSLITRPRRFGKTLMLSTIEHFFSTKYTGRSDLFEGLDVWQDEKMRTQQGKWPVIFLSLAEIKASDFDTQREQIIREIVRLYYKFQDFNSPETSRVLLSLAEMGVPVKPMNVALGRLSRMIWAMPILILPLAVPSSVFCRVNLGTKP